MANDLVAFQGGPNEAFGWANPNEESLSDGIGSSYGIIGYKASRWTLRYRGETFMFTRPDGTPNPHLNVIILGQARTKSKSYYPKYVEGSDDPPTCASIDSVTPDAGVTQRQADACSLCPRNVLTINPQTGKKTTECKDHKRLGVLLLPAESQRLLGEPLLEPVFLRVPAASLQNLSRLGDQTSAMGYAFFTFVTRIEFDTSPTISYPKMIFRAVQQLTAKQAPLIKDLRNSPELERIITGGGQTRPALAAPVQQAALPTSGAVETGFDVIPPSGVGTRREATAVAPRMKDVTPVNDNKQAPVAANNNKQAPAAPQAAIDLGGFGDDPAPAPAPAASPPSQAAPQQVVSDTGPATAADEDMDARIALLMPK